MHACVGVGVGVNNNNNTTNNNNTNNNNTTTTNNHNHNNIINNHTQVTSKVVDEEGHIALPAISYRVRRVFFLPMCRVKQSAVSICLSIYLSSLSIYPSIRIILCLSPSCLTPLSSKTPPPQKKQARGRREREMKFTLKVDGRETATAVCVPVLLTCNHPIHPSEYRLRPAAGCVAID